MAFFSPKFCVGVRWCLLATYRASTPPQEVRLRSARRLRRADRKFFYIPDPLWKPDFLTDFPKLAFAQPQMGARNFCQILGPPTQFFYPKFGNFKNFPFSKAHISPTNHRTTTVNPATDAREPPLSPRTTAHHSPRITQQLSPENPNPQKSKILKFSRISKILEFQFWTCSASFRAKWFLKRKLRKTQSKVIAILVK